MKIGIVILATNAYFALGVRFMKKFMQHYQGDAEIKFFFFSDENPKDSVQDSMNVVYKQDSHICWSDAPILNSKI